MYESALERKICDYIKTLGGKAYKWVSPGAPGVPDRIAILPGGRIIFIEVKRPGLSDGLECTAEKGYRYTRRARLYCMAYIRYGRLEREVTWSIDLIFIRNMRNNLFWITPKQAYY